MIKQVTNKLKYNVKYKKMYFVSKASSYCFPISALPESPNDLNVSTALLWPQ